MSKLLLEDFGERGIVSGPCKITGKNYSVTIVMSEYWAWKNGALAQDALTSLNAEDREFVMPGISPEGWKQLFGDDDE